MFRDTLTQEEMNTVLNDIDDGMCWVNYDEEQAARLVLSRLKGEPEPVLYDDEPTPSVGDYDKEAYLNDYIDVQEVMATLMRRIEKGTSMIIDKKNAKYDAQCGNWLRRDGYIKLCLDIKKYEAHRSDLWSQWWDLKAKCDGIQEECSSVYPMYKKIEDGEEDDRYDRYDPIWHKKSAPEIDNRMLLTDEATYEAHMEEQEEFFVYNS